MTLMHAKTKQKKKDGKRGLYTEKSYDSQQTRNVKGGDPECGRGQTYFKRGPSAWRREEAEGKNY